MAENSDKTTRKIRGTGKPFAKGQSGNPGGRPKKRKDLAERCKALTDKVLAEFESILECGKAGEKVEVGKVILAYAYGKPDSMSKVEISGKGEGGAIIFKWELNG